MHKTVNKLLIITVITTSLLYMVYMLYELKNNDQDMSTK